MEAQIVEIVAYSLAVGIVCLAVFCLATLIDRLLKWSRESTVEYFDQSHANRCEHAWEIARASHGPIVRCWKCYEVRV